MYTTLSPFYLLLVAPSHERSDLSSDHSVGEFACLVGWLYGCLLTFARTSLPPTPHKIIRSQKFQNQNVFCIILSNFFLGGGTPPW